jgi:rod shape-determining protein MreC
VVSIFTYRDERKLFAVVGTVIVAALLAVLQLEFIRAGRTSPLTATVTTVTTWAQLAISVTLDAVRGGASYVVRIPALERENTELRARVDHLERDDRTLAETLARIPAEAAAARAQVLAPAGIAATIIGYDPENAQHIVTIDRGAKDHIQLDDGVIAGDGVVGRIVEVDPLSAKVLLINDPASRLPALIQRGRWWAIAVGTQTKVQLRFVSQDAHLRVGDAVVTGAGRSFRAGMLIGRISSVEPMPAGALDQAAIVTPTVDLAAITQVVVVPK